jgi:Resolvase, N terminal domain
MRVMTVANMSMMMPIGSVVRMVRIFGVVEACEAYIKSQAHEGWRPVANCYDDGGLSGASLERPALQALLADIRAGAPSSGFWSVATVRLLRFAALYI